MRGQPFRQAEAALRVACRRDRVQCRQLAGERLSRVWNVQVVPDNRPGGGGNIGTEQCARAPADGYTLCMFSIAQSISPAIYSEIVDDMQQFAGANWNGTPLWGSRRNTYVKVLVE